MSVIIKAWEVRGAKIPPPQERTIKVILAPDVTSTKECSFLHTFISPGSQTDLHAHAGAEVISVLRGRGEAILDTKLFQVEPDMILYVPSDVRHQMRNTGDETMKLVCIFIPPIPAKEIVERAKEAAKATT